MKYLTIDWLITDRLSLANRLVRKSKQAEQFNETFYQRIYQKHCEQYVLNEKGNDFYHDPREELQGIDRLINSPDASEEEHEKWRRFKEDFIYLNKERIEKNIFYPFDETTEKRNFETWLKNQIKLYEHLPQYILNKIPDLRMFALGYTSAEVKGLLKPYCAELRKISSKIKKKAFAETDDAETYLSERLNVNEYEELLLSGYEYKDNDLYLNFDYGDKLLIKDGNITEGADHTIYPFDTNIPHCGWSQVLAAELHQADDKYEIHFLISNLNETNECEVWYLTAVGTDIQEIIAPQNVELNNLLNRIQGN